MRLQVAKPILSEKRCFKIICKDFTKKNVPIEWNYCFVAPLSKNKN